MLSNESTVKDRKATR